MVAEITYPLGLSRDDNHWYTANYPAMGIFRERMVSVTGVIKMVDKSGPLMGWTRRVTAEAAIDNRAELDKWVELGGRDGAVGLLTKAATQKRDTAANVGSEVHALAEAIARGQTVPVPENLAPYLAAFQAWLREWQPEYLAAEEMVFSLEHDYAGTLDAIVKVAGETWLIDLKSSKGVYAETALQLAAYANAQWIGRPGVAKPFRIPKIDNYGVLHLTPEGYSVVPFDVTERTFAAFLHARSLHRWAEGEAKTVMGQPIGRVPTFQARAKEIA